MNSVLLWLGIVVALLLTAAFAAPFFIDWSGQRAFFEARASEMLGRPVAFEGALEVRLVPLPRLVARNVRVGENVGEGAEEVRIDAALMPLLSGELRISEVAIVQPRLHVALDDQGRIDWRGQRVRGALPIGPEQSMVDRFRIVNGTIAVHDGRSGTVREVSGLNMEGAATTLAGPFRFEGGANLDGRRHTFRVMTGRVQGDGTLRLTGSVQPADRPLTVSFDGTLRGGAERPRYDGRITAERPEMEGVPGLPWRLEAHVEADLVEAVTERMRLQIGPEARRVVLAGAANARFGARPGFDAVLSARQIDLDRVLGGGPEAPVAPADVLAQLADVLDPALFAIPGMLAVDVGSLVVSGNLIENFGVELAVDGSRWVIEAAELYAPGRTEVGLAGTLAFAEAGPSLNARLRIASQQSARFASWLMGAEDRLQGFGQLIGGLDASASLVVSPAEIALEQVRVDAGETALRGSAAYRAASGGRPARLEVAIETDRFELGDPVSGPAARWLGPLARLAGEPDGLELDVEIAAAVLAVGDVEVNGVSFALASAGGDLTIERLNIADLGGLGASGAGAVRKYATRPEGSMSLRIGGESLDSLVSLIRGFGYANAAQALSRRAAELVPMHLELELNAGRADAGNRVELAMRGEAGATSLDGEADFEGFLEAAAESVVALRLDARSDDAPGLAAQIGLPQAAATPGGGHLALRAQGRPTEGLEYALETAGIGIDGGLDGRAIFTARGATQIAGDLHAHMPRPDVLLEAAGIALPGGELSGGVSLSGALSGVGEVWHLSDILLDAGGLQARGTATVDAGAQRSFDASMEADMLDLRWLLAAMLGPGAMEMSAPVAYGDPVWPSVAFAPVESGEWRGRVALRAPRLALGRGFSASDAAVVVTLAPDRMALTGLRGQLLGGRLVGDLDMSLLGGGVGLEARFELADARLEDFVWQDGGRAIASGTLTAGIDVRGSGRSLLGLVSTLSGEGAFRVSEGKVRRINPRAFDRIVAAADAGLDTDSERVREVFAGHLDAGQMRFSEAQGAVSVASGVARTRNVRVDADELAAFASATVDLTVMGIDSEWSLRAADEPEDGRSREAGVVFAGPLAEPVREIDVNPLMGYLTVRAFERDVRRLEELQADIMERQRFDRELRWLREDGARREREAAEEATLRQMQEEAARRRAEEEEAARLRAEEEEAARLRAEEEEAARRSAEEEEARRQAEEEARRQAAADRRRQDEAAFQQLIREALREGIPPSPEPGWRGPIDIRPGSGQ